MRKTTPGKIQTFKIIKYTEKLNLDVWGKIMQGDHVRKG